MKVLIIASLGIFKDIEKLNQIKQNIEKTFVQFREQFIVKTFKDVLDIM